MRLSVLKLTDSKMLLSLQFFKLSCTGGCGAPECIEINGLEDAVKLAVFQTLVHGRLRCASAAVHGSSCLVRWVSHSVLNPSRITNGGCAALRSMAPRASAVCLVRSV